MVVGEVGLGVWLAAASMAASGRPATSVVAARGAAGQPFDLAADWTRLSRMHEV